MFERALICTDLFDGLHRLVHCVPHLALSGLKQVIFLHSIPIWEQPTLAAVDQAKIDAAKEKLFGSTSLAIAGMTDISLLIFQPQLLSN
ncbi:hypothetical protein N0824_03753 [Microcystis sp. 0824]|nr:hypothetical protein N0824_03753 [Microcystis sp. 0824]